MGESEYNNRVEYYMLKNPSVKPPQHRKRLLTFTGKRTRRKKGSEIAKSNTTNVLQKWYEKADPAIIVSSLKPGWIPHASIKEEMFLIKPHGVPIKALVIMLTF